MFRVTCILSGNSAALFSVRRFWQLSQGREAPILPLPGKIRPESPFFFPAFLFGIFPIFFFFLRMCVRGGLLHSFFLSFHPSFSLLPPSSPLLKSNTGAAPLSLSPPSRVRKERKRDTVNSPCTYSRKKNFPYHNTDVVSHPLSIQ